MIVFVDTSAWIAFFNKNDDFHKSAVSFFRKKPKLFSSNIVLHETIAHLQYRVDRLTAETAASLILNPLLVQLIYISEEEEKQAYKKYQTGLKKISFVDWTSEVLMKTNKIKRIFTFNKHFLKMGLKIIS